MSDDIVERLSVLKTKVQNANDNKNRAKGTVDEILHGFKKDYGCKTIEEAQKKYEDLVMAIEANKKKLREGLEELERILQ
jgi:hypothetical protein